MAYCNKCGAYIPDGETTCLACGYDEIKEQQAAAAAAVQEEKNKRGGRKHPAHPASASTGGTYYQFTSEQLREQLEEQRRKQKENSDKWAAAEAERRRARQESERQGASVASQIFDNIGDTVKEFERKASSNPRSISILSYLGPLWLVQKFMGTRDEFSRFHSGQGLRLIIFGLIANALTRVVGVPLTVFLAICGIRNVLNGEMRSLPIIGEWWK